MTSKLIIKIAKVSEATLGSTYGLYPEGLRPLKTRR